MKTIYVKNVDKVAGSDLHSGWKHPMSVIYATIDLDDDTHVHVIMLDYGYNYDKWLDKMMSHVYAEITPCKRLYTHSWVTYKGDDKEADRAFIEEISKEYPVHDSPEYYYNHEYPTGI